MADTSPLAGLLDRAGLVFSLADQLGWAFQREREGQGKVVKVVDPTSWECHRPAFDEFCAAVLELREPMQNPPDGFAPVAQALLDAARLAKQIRGVMQTTYGITWAQYLDFYPHLNKAAGAGRRAIREVKKALRLDDPFAFVDRPATGKEVGIDTTPTPPKPPPSLIEEAARAIPEVLANIPPDREGTIGLETAAHLVSLVQKAGHTRAAARWAVHEAVQAGRLRVGPVEAGVPHILTSSSGPVPRGCKPIPSGKPAPFDCFKVVATESLCSWWNPGGGAGARTSNPTGAPGDGPGNPREGARVGATAEPPTSNVKRSTKRGEGRAKLIAALTEHHRYAQDGCLRTEPINNNALARLAKVDKATASAFFKKEFGGHGKYKRICQDTGRLVVYLKQLNGEYTPDELFGGNPPGEDDRDDPA